MLNGSGGRSGLAVFLFGVGDFHESILRRISGGMAGISMRKQRKGGYGNRMLLPGLEGGLPPSDACGDIPPNDVVVIMFLAVFLKESYRLKAFILCNNSLEGKTGRTRGRRNLQKFTPGRSPARS